MWRGVLFAWFLSWTDLHPLDGLLGSGGLLLGKRVECLLSAVEKHCPVFAQVLEMPGALRGARSI